ncbi:unnamed protein product [Hapterophycus canaliculatus]
MEDGDDEEEGDEDDEPARDMSEITVAVREAQACGARVLLGDRDYETTGQLLEKAKRLDMASAKEREKFSELTASFDCEVMAKHLMKLRGKQTTVAVFGLAHLDGVEKVLKGHGWKRQWPQR